MNKKIVIIAKPCLGNKDNDKFYIIRSNSIEEVTLIGDIALNGSIVSIANTYEEARQVVQNLS